MSNKRYFLLNDYIRLLNTLDPEAKAEWGKMNPHQMVDHMTYSFQLGNGRIKVEKLLSPEESIPKLQNWLLTNKPMRENINNPLVSTTPPEPRYPTFEESIAELYNEIVRFYQLFDAHENLTVLNPFYGDLDNVHYTNLLYKHALHHLRQFGIDVEYLED
ncbi:MAG: DUF1569 domain-containing protein [Saprospiraceae bacterium]|nr:DUF1569 domain-containing protein [Saprospiraceae bacterium]